MKYDGRSNYFQFYPKLEKQVRDGVLQVPQTGFAFQSFSMERKKKVTIDTVDRLK